MASSRYWRITLIPKVRNGPVEISLLHLYLVATRVDATGTLTSSIAPTSGSMANVQDTSLANGALWASVLKQVVLTWDFGGSPVDVSGWSIGSADTEANFPAHARLESSTDGVTWTDIDHSIERFVTDYKHLIWPGPRTLSANYRSSEWSMLNYLRQPQADGSTGIVTFSNGNRTYSVGVITNIGRFFMGAVGRRTGVRQFELKRNTGSAAVAAVGIRIGSGVTRQAGDGPDDWVYQTDAKKGNNGTYAAYGATWTATADILGIVVDFTAGTITFYKNGVSQGIAYTSAALVGALAYPITGMNSTNLNGFTLECDTFVYPIAGATAWGGNTYPAVELWSKDATPSVPSYTAELLAPVGFTGVASTLIADSPRDYRFQNWGGQVYGTVKIDGTPTDAPVRRRVRLYREIDGLLVQQQWSNPATGAYSFQYLETDHLYTVISDDYTASFRAVVADKIVPEAMP